MKGISVFFKVMAVIIFVSALVVGILLASIEIPGFDTAKITFPLMIGCWGNGFINGMIMLMISWLIKKQLETDDKYCQISKNSSEVRKKTNSSSDNSKKAGSDKHAGNTKIKSRPRFDQVYDLPFCPNCGEAQTPGMAVCWKCGAEFGGESKSLEPDNYTEPDDYAEAAELLDDDNAPRVSGKCSYCGKRRDDLYYVRITDQTGSHYEKICEDCVHVYDLGKKD